MPRIGPRLPEDADLARLLDLKGLARLVLLERGALQVHPVLRGPDRGRVGRRAPPDAVAQSRGVWLQPKQAGRVGKHGSRIGPGEAFAFQQLEKYFCMTAA